MTVFRLALSSGAKREKDPHGKHRQRHYTDAAQPFHPAHNFPFARYDRPATMRL